jgi:RNA polymerase sigma-70 factor (ECF subfamily)
LTDKKNEFADLSKKASELARGIMSGDKYSGNEFVSLHYRWLLYVVRKKFSRVSSHEDIVQDSFMLVITKLQQGLVNNPDTIRSYLRTTAINIGYEYLRKDKKYISAVDQDSLDIFEDVTSDVLSNLEWDNGINHVKQIMTELPTDRDREILTQFYFEDQDKTEICKKLDLSSEHFDRVLYRAKQRLKELISKHDDYDNQQSSTQGKLVAVKPTKGSKLITKIIQFCLGVFTNYCKVLTV